MKSYTDLEQSQKLAKILSLESADMCRTYDFDTKCFTIKMYPYSRLVIPKYADSKITNPIPAWSLAALLNVLPEVSLNSFKDGNWNAMVKQNGKMIYGDTGDPIDACYELILKLHEHNLI